MKTTVPDHKGHLTLVHVYRAARRQIDEFACTIWRQFPKTHRVSRQADKISKAVAELQNLLDCEYHRVTSEAQFKKAGHIYYNDPERLFHVELLKWVHSLEYGHPRYRDPEKGELVLGLYRDEDSVSPILLWADPNIDLFYDVGLRQHVKPPKFYLRIDAQGQAAANLGIKQLTFEGME